MTPEPTAAIDQTQPRPAAGSYTAVIFDMDGIVADTEHLWDAGWAAFARSHGREWTHSDSMRLQGMSVPEWSAQLAADSGVPDQAEQAADSCVQLIVDAIGQGDGQLMNGARELIDFTARRVPIGLATSSDRRIIDTLLSVRGIDHHFTATVSSSEVARGKPSPDVYLEAARRIGVIGVPVSESGATPPPTQATAPPTVPTRLAAIGIEDSGNGIRASHAAGLYTIAIPNQQFPPAADALAVADYVARDHADALAHLRTLLPEPPPT